MSDAFRKKLGISKFKFERKISNSRMLLSKASKCKTPTLYLHISLTDALHPKLNS